VTLPHDPTVSHWPPDLDALTKVVEQSDIPFGPRVELLLILKKFAAAPVPSEGLDRLRILFTEELTGSGRPVRWYTDRLPTVKVQDAHAALDRAIARLAREKAET
jgi:hypothetical protein